MLEGLARFQEYTVRYGWEMCFPWYVRLVRLVDTVGTVGWYGWHGWYRLLVRLNRTNRSQKPYQWTVPPYRTRLGGGSRGGGRFGCTNTTLVLVHPKRPPLTPPLIWYGTVVRFIGTVGTVGTLLQRTKRTLLSVPTVPTVPYQAYKAYQPYRTKRTKRTKRSVPIL